MDCNSCPIYTTTQRADYVLAEKFERTPKCPKKEQTDEALITGHDFNNLMVNKRQQVSKTWPHTMDNREEYSTFLQRLKTSDPKKYDRRFQCPKIDFDYIEQTLELGDTSIYGISYSPHKYTSLWGQKRTICKHDTISTCLNYFTTYRDAYNRMNLEKQFRNLRRDIKQGLKPQGDQDVYAAVLRKYFKQYNPTTYHDTICLPALVMADGKMPQNYIDQYSSRKL